MQLHLHLPGLLGPLPREAAGLLGAGGPAARLSRLLSRGSPHPRPDDDPDRRRLQLFGVAPPVAGDLPVGPLSALGETGAETGAEPPHERADGAGVGGVGDVAGNWWYRADPVHLLPDRDRLLVTDPGRLALDARLVADFARQFNALFAEDGIFFQAPHPDRWYLRLATAPAMTTTPLQYAMGRPMGEHLPTGPDARQWISHLNAIQMLLHGSALNQQREQAGKPTINGLWPWGGGVLPAAPASQPWTLVCTDEPLVRGLARLCGARCTSPLTLADCLERARGLDGHGSVLVDQEAFPAVQDGQSFQDWESALNAFLTDWAIPLEAALASRRLDRLLIDTNRRCWELTPGMLRRFWRRTPDLTHWLELTPP